MLEFAKSKGIGEGPKEDPMDFLGEESEMSVLVEERVNSFRGDDIVMSVDPAEETVRLDCLPRASGNSSPSEESEESPVKGIDLIWLAL